MNIQIRGILKAHLYKVQMWFMHTIYLLFVVYLKRLIASSIFFVSKCANITLILNISRFSLFLG